LKELAIVLPTYNEAKNLPILINKIDEFLKEKPWVIVVDDNSPDGTGILAEDLAKKRGKMLVIHRKEKLGLGSAYLEAFKLVLEKIPCEFIVTMDSDLSHHPYYIKKFLEREEDIIIGSRYIKGGYACFNLRRRIVSLVANFLARRLLRLKVRDCTNGFRAYKVKALKLLMKFKFKARGYFFQIEILKLANRMKLKIFEYPIIFYTRGEGKSKLNFKEILNFLFLILHYL